MSKNSAALAVVVKGWPRLSETFIAQELAALEDRGYTFDIWSLRFPTDKKRHPLHDRLTARVRYLPEYLHQEPRRVFKAWRACRSLPGYGHARKIWWRDLLRDKTRNRIRRFGQACVMAVESPAQTEAFYAHFLHTPSSVARYTAIMRGLPWGFSAHAKDIWTSPEWEIREKLSDNVSGAKFGVTCTAFGADHLRDLATDPARVDLLYHGLDLTRFPPPPERETDPQNPFRLLSVGRLVEKKGFDRLIPALALLPKHFDWRWVHIGGGPLKGSMAKLAEQHGVQDRIVWRGACDQPEVIEAMRSSDLFVLPSRVATDGDRDGLPNVLMEAASQLLPILSTPVSAIPEFITNGHSGVLVNDNAADLSSAIIDLAGNPEQRKTMAAAALDRLKNEFGMERGIEQLRKRLDTMLSETKS
ncbi:MAG: glycosyltransferase family 4 protein [Rhodobacteraceae bacterium]|nr:glycosyltransferase family 4 protein [Paracoccaceae bacterium]